MKTSLRPTALMACLLSTVLAMPAAAECLKVIGTEGGGTGLTMDPAFNNLNDDSYQQNLVFNKLVNVDPNFQPIPELASSWSVSEDGKTWTFTLEDGVTFHDGKPLTAADVAELDAVSAGKPIYPNWLYKGEIAEKTVETALGTIPR